MVQASSRPVRATLRILCASAFALALSACGGKPFEYRSSTEIPEGPGLLTGEQGAIVLAGPASTRTPGSPGRRGDALAPADSAEFADYEAFREFRRAKENRSPEYREFLEWKEYQQYRDWRNKRDSGSR
jgi:hypothetical protein